MKYLTAVESSASPRCSEDSCGLFGGAAAGLLDDESAMNEANVLAVLDAVEATVGILGKEKEDPDETSRADVGNGNDDCEDDVVDVKEVDDEPKPVNPPNFGDEGGCSSVMPFPLVLGEGAGLPPTRLGRARIFLVARTASSALWGPSLDASSASS